MQTTQCVGLVPKSPDLLPQSLAQRTPPLSIPEGCAGLVFKGLGCHICTGRPLTFGTAL